MKQVTKQKRIAVLLMSLLLAFSLAACQNTLNTSSDTTKGSTGEKQEETSGEKIVNIGMTDTLTSINPLLMDATEILKYAAAFEFLPLVELNSKLEFEGMLASSITTEDNIHFTVKIDDKAVWSDGVPVTAEDVVFTVLKLASPKLANASMALYAFEGIGDDGFVEEGATEISGVKAIDEKTVEFTAKYKMALTTFENTYGRYILTVPKHILQEVADEDLAAYDWFNAPTVVNGPYQVTDVDLQHFVTYTANKNYWKGVPKIEKLNIKILPAPQILTSLQSGEIDFVQQTTGNILQEDYGNVEALSNITVYYGAPVTNQSIFFNTTSVTDTRIRQAILYGIDRENILNGLLNGKGEIVDGFLSSAGPFYDASLAPTAYNPEKAKELIKEAEADGWDSSRVLNFYVNSGDTTFTQAADYIAAQLGEIGIKIQVTTVDLATLMSTAGSKSFDIMAVQYTYAPVDPYPDINWLLSADGWTGFANGRVAEALAATQTTSDIAEIKEQYLTINTIAQEEVPMISAYVISAMGAVNNRLKNATPDVYGSFINVQNWDVTE
ncbi:peptide ABC transporter substrate-binding protein [Anaerocolumna cellulosilytica]|uniref:Peptide ABC transporter substrate-binding protein n=1 Tax=Anaerocolumna cellulosilytica TaxID=433286 RepID=A0A6S6R640_9FIRM|nr:ABC transporter substrate-binding protein [Anaerocolumna cellulosilytica]MBB5193864.1 peptide/nickel transport system substrate-binding protein [Anaerocolumna cellulosilytica]BCJ94920.1 peptide ABC transporter substrate-binding protein [Anaerocolumna cellulosilytica]